MLTLLFAVVVARELPQSGVDLRPVGPLSQAVAQSYQDLDAVQDHILAAQAEESKEMDRLLGPAPHAHPSSFIQTSDEPEPVIDFSDLDNIQGKLSKLHKKMAGELGNLKKITSEDEDFERQAELDAKNAREKDLSDAIQEGAPQPEVDPKADGAFDIPEIGLSGKDAAPSSFMETESKTESKSDVESRKLMAMVQKLNQMKGMFSPVMNGLESAESPEALYAQQQLKKLSGANGGVVELMLNMVNAIKRKDPLEEKKSMDALKKGMAAVKLQMKQQHDEILAHRAQLPKPPLGDRLGAAIHMAMDPLQAHFEGMMQNDPKTATEYDVPMALEKIKSLRESALHSSVAIADAAEKLKSAHTDEESKAIQHELSEELKASKENIKLGWAQIQALSSAMALMPRKGMQASPYTDVTAKFRARMARAIMKQPKLHNSKLVMQGLSHTAAIDSLSRGYEQIAKLLPRIVQQAPDELAKRKGVQALRILLGSVQQQADHHSAELDQIEPIFAAVAGDPDPSQHLAEPWSLVQGEKAWPEPQVQLPTLPPKGQAASDTAEKQYQKIQTELLQMQGNLQNQVVSLKQQEQVQSNKQVQDLDALMTPHDTMMRSMPLPAIMSALETKANATATPARAFRGADLPAAA